MSRVIGLVLLLAAVGPVGPALLAVSSVALAQPAPPPPQQLPPHLRGAFAPVAEDGVIQQFVMNVPGHVDGFILTTGMQVAMPPHMGEAAASLWKPGDRVRIDGFRGVRNGLAQVVLAWGIHSTQDERSLVDEPGRRPPPPPSPGPEETVTGRVRQVLFTIEGQPVGAILDQGPQLAWRPDQIWEERPLIPGATITARGRLKSGRAGAVLAVDALTVEGGS